ncbi:MAG: CNP1-like family protein [Burkholderiaceae bacterium]
MTSPGSEKRSPNQLGARGRPSQQVISTGRENFRRALPLAFVLGLPVGPVNAQIGDVDIPYGGPPPAIESEAQTGPSLVLPQTLPKVIAFADMMPFDVDATTPNTFALDPASVQLTDRYMLATVAVQSPSGAVTNGLYGFACDYGQYRLMAYPRKNGRWQPASKRVKWREIHDGESRNRQFRAVYKAGCRVGGQSAESVDEVLRYLRDGRVVESP